MKHLKIYTLLFALLYTIFFVGTKSEAQKTPKPKILFFSLEEEIFPSAGRLVHRALTEARNTKADFVFIKLNTFGGMLDVADSIRTEFLNFPIPIYVLIDKNAASAGALISIACDKIFMAEGSTIGAAVVVDQEGKQMPEKYQSYMRGMMRATAEHQGRNPQIAESMVGAIHSIAGVIDSGKVVTFTTDEAIKNGYCDGKVSNMNEAMHQCGVDDYEQVTYEKSWVDRLIGWLQNPAVNSILLLVILGGLYFEFQHPGIGFPLLAMLVGAILYFAPLYLDGLAANWEILIFFIGVLLLALEIFVFPGHMVWAITGLALIIGGLTLALLRNNDFDFSYSGTGAAIIALLRVSVVLGGVIVFALFIGPKFFDTKLAKRIVLTDVQSSSAGYTMGDEHIQALKGQTGKAETDLRPGGKVRLGDSVYDAVSEGGFISIGTNVQVITAKGKELVVRTAVA